jgi:HSP20 family molecular chaperone IbpA
MTTLMPRLFGDLVDWLETPLHPGYLIRVEDRLTEQDYQLRAELPGVDPDQDIRVSVDDGMMTIVAERREKEEAHGRSEFRYGMFRRAVRLPANADAEHITAAYDRGVLAVTVPLTAPTSSGRKIPVTTAAE